MALARYTVAVDGTIPIQALVYDDEQVFGEQDDVGIYDGPQKAPDYQSGTAYVTSHRLFYIDKVHKRKRSFALDLSYIEQSEYYAGLFTSSSKVTLYLSRIPQSSDRASSGIDTLSGSSESDIAFESWECHICGYKNAPGLSPTASRKCGLCGVPRSNSTPSGSSETTSRAQTPIHPSSSLPSSSLPSVFSTSASGQTGSSMPCPACTFLNYPSLPECEICFTPLPRKPTAPKSMKSAPSTRPASPDSGLSPSAVASRMIKLSFRKGGDKAFYTILKTSLRNKVWQDVKPLSIDPEGNRAHKSGIDGILRSVEASHFSAKSGMDGAFQDLETLMTKAKDMVRLAADLNEKLTAATAAQQQSILPLSSSSSSSSSSEPEEATFIRSSLSQLGLQMKDAPVTLDMMKDEREWVDRLAKELAGVLQGDSSTTTRSWSVPARSQSESGLMRERGIIALDEVWGGWNRARGVALIPPSTMLLALPQLFSHTDPPIRVRSFGSGLTVLHTPSFTEAAFAARMYEFLALSGPKSTLQIAMEENISVGLAKELVYAVEKSGYVCRDDAGACAIGQGGVGSGGGGDEMVRWWHNLFRDWKWDGQT